MNEYKYFSREGLASKTSEQADVKKRIEKEIENVSPEEYDRFVLDRRRDDLAQSVRDLLGQVLDQQRNYKTLEVGAGTGITTNRLNELNNLQVTALDNRKDFLDFAIKHGRMRKGQVVLGDFTELPFEDNSFDLYTGTAILNQRDDIDKFYEEAVRVLKKDGLIIIPWAKTREGSIEREKYFFQKFSITIQREGDWFLIGKK